MNIINKHIQSFHVFTSTTLLNHWQGVATGDASGRK